MQTFFPWQKNQWDHLSARAKNHKLPHALLLTGKQGSGKLIFARAFAEYLLCDKATEPACANCTACTWLQAETHPDLLIVQPEETGKTIKIEQVRTIIDMLAKTSQRGSYQIVIIEPAENMNNAAANALLKTLEEPAGKVLLILVTQQPALLPATLRSRCQQIHFNAQHIDEMINWLATQLNSREQAEALLKLSDYAPLQALQYAQSDYLSTQNKIFVDLKKLLQQEIDPVQCAANYNKQDIKITLLMLSNILTELIKIKLTGNSNGIISKEIIAARTLADQLTLEKLFTLYQQIIEDKRWLSKNVNLNATLVLENLLIQWIHKSG